MAKYTVALRSIVEQTEDDNSFDPLVGEYRQATYDMLGLSDYPIFEPAYRTGLNDKIIDNFYFREIGQETVAQFRWYMRKTLNNIMPYYNQLYKSELLEIDPLKDYERVFSEKWHENREGSETNNDSLKATNDTKDSNTTSGKQSVDSTDKKTGTDDTSTIVNDTVKNTANGTKVFSDTPMNMLDDGTGSSAIAKAKYATDVTYDDNDGTTTDNSTTQVNDRSTADGAYAEKATNESSYNGTANTESTQSSDRSQKTASSDDGTRSHDESGFTQAQSELLAKWRKTFINIDAMIMEELQTLFMGLW